MLVLPNMGLYAWNHTMDPYNSQQLAGNFARLDDHDHSPGKGKRIGTASIQDGAITPAKLAIGAIGTSTINDGAVTDAKLARPLLVGVVNSGGSIAQGTGFTVAKGGTGAYTITFSTAYSTAPIALVGSSGGTSISPQVLTTTTTMTVNLTVPESGVATDAKFNFLVREV